MDPFKLNLETGMFTFLVNGKQFQAHEGLIAATSSSLSAMMMNGQLKESKTRIATIGETDPSTFANYLEFVYTGNYSLSSTTTNPDAKNDTDMGNVQFTSRDEDSWDWGNKKAKGKFRSESHSQWHAFEKLKFSTDTLTDKHLEFGIPPFRRGTSISEDVVCHAKLYDFAQLHMVDDLRVMCLYKLHQDLLRFKLSANNVERLIELFRYVYNNTVEESEGHIEKQSSLRNVVMPFMVAKARELMHYELFSQLLEEGGEMVTDFCQGIAKWMN